MRTKTILFCLIVGALTIGIATAEYNPWEIQPNLPMAIRGNVYIDGQLAMVGTVVSASGYNVGENIYGNPVSIPKNPFGLGLCDHKLIIQGTPVKQIDPTGPAGQYAVPEGSPVTIKINDIPAKVRFENTDAWLDTIPFKSGGAYVVDISIGEMPEQVVHDYTMTPESYSATWDPYEQKIVDKMLAHKFTRVRQLGVHMDGLKNNWWNKNYDVNWENVNKAPAYVKTLINRQIAYGESGGYTTNGPQLDAMLDAQNWNDCKWMIPYYWQDVGWTRWSADEYFRYNPPSLFIPPK
jgi:hypothetical protein